MRERTKIVLCYQCGLGTVIDMTYAGEKYCSVCGDVLGFVNTEEKFIAYHTEDEVI